MKTIDLIRANHLRARKSKDPVLTSTYGALISAMDQSRIDTNDEAKVHTAIKKEVASMQNANSKMNELLSTATSDADKASLSSEIDKNTKLIDELNILLPSYMTSDEIKLAIGDQYSGMNIGEARKIAMSKLDGRDYEMRTLMDIIKSAIK